MTGSREKDSADFDLEAFIDLFDEALTSDDASVQKTLQHLMVIAALARNHARHDQRNGPLRRLFDDQKNIIRRLERLETGPAQFPGGGFNPGTPYGPVIMPQPYRPTTPVPGTGGGSWPGPGPNQIWCGSSGSATSMTLDPGFGAVPPVVAKQTTASEAVAERIEDLLKSDYKGSSVGTKNVKIT
jgi:hypothetical protein